MDRFINFRGIALLVLLAALLWAAAGFMTAPSVQAQASHGFITYADITGTGAAAQVDSIAGHTCRWVQLVTPSTNSATLARWGDSNISSTRGGTIAAGGGQFLPPIPAPSGGEQFYDITKLYVLAANGDKVSVVCGQ